MNGRSALPDNPSPGDRFVLLARPGLHLLLTPAKIYMRIDDCATTELSVSNHRSSRGSRAMLL